MEVSAVLRVVAALGVLSSRIVIIKRASTLRNAEIVIDKAGRLPGRTSTDDHSKWPFRALNMLTGVGHVRRTRKMLNQEDE